MRDIGLGKIQALAVIAIAVAVWIALFRGWDSLTRFVGRRFQGTLFGRSRLAGRWVRGRTGSAPIRRGGPSLRRGLVPRKLDSVTAASGLSRACQDALGRPSR